TRFSRDWSSDVCSSDLRIDGEFSFDNGRFLFGVNSSDSKMRRLNVDGHAHLMTLGDWTSTDRGQIADIANHLRKFSITRLFEDRSEERRVGKGWRDVW